MITQKRKDGQLNFEDLVIAKVGTFCDLISCVIRCCVVADDLSAVLFCTPQATYEKGTRDEIEEFIYQLLDVDDDGNVTR